MLISGCFFADFRLFRGAMLCYAVRVTVTVAMLCVYPSLGGLVLGPGALHYAPRKLAAAT